MTRHLSTHTCSHTQSAATTSTRCKCHSSPSTVTPVRPMSLLRDRVITPSIHTPVSICLFVCWCHVGLWSVPSPHPCSVLHSTLEPVVRSVLSVELPPLLYYRCVWLFKKGLLNPMKTYFSK